MRLTARLAAVVVAGLGTAGCAGPSGTARWKPCLGPRDLALAVPTFGIYNLACAQAANAQQYANWQAQDVDRWVSAGGDPARCRCAVYGCNRTNVNVDVYR